MARIVSHDPRLIEALKSLGVNTDTASRIVIDIKAGCVPIVHIELMGDENTINVVRSLDGIDITRKDGSDG